MHVQPNTPPLAFLAIDICQSFDDVTREEMERTASDMLAMARHVAGSDVPAGLEMQLAQGAASLQLVAFYSFGATRVPAPIRRELRTLRKVKRAWLTPFASLMCALLLFACGDARELAASELEPGSNVGEPLPELEHVHAAPSTGASVEADDHASADAATSHVLEVDDVAVDEVDVLELDGVACTGHWVESDDVGTRLQAHPDTGVCTLPCQIVGPQRNTCTPEHRIHLAELCAELGGACTLASDGLSYCVAQ